VPRRDLPGHRGSGGVNRRASAPGRPRRRNVVGAVDSRRRRIATPVYESASRQHEQTSRLFSHTSASCAKQATSPQDCNAAVRDPGARCRSALCLPPPRTPATLTEARKANAFGSIGWSPSGVPRRSGSGDWSTEHSSATREHDITKSTLILSHN